MRSRSSVRKHVANSAILKAWEQFTDSGELSSKAIRKVIGQRWLKSKELGIPTDINRAPTVITADEITELERTESLVLASKNALHNFEHTLSDTEHVVVIADASSRILYSVGHQEIQEKLEHINFRPGADWSEELVGPNGVGTSLSLGRPEIVMGYEHYCEAWQPWVCYGAPIYDSTGSILKGTIDITGSVERTSQESMAMAISLAHSVSANLSVEQYKNRERLCAQGKRLLQRWNNDCVLILDKHAEIVDFNCMAANLFAPVTDALLYQQVTDLIPEVCNLFTQCMRVKKAGSIEIHNQQSPGLAETMTISLEPVNHNQEFLGFAAIVNVKNKEQLLTQISLDKPSTFQAIGDELILQTLEKTGFNVSRAAKLLGIDRSTIYRRMRKRPQN